MRRRHRVLLLLLVGTATAGGFADHIPFRIGFGESMPAGLYWLENGPVALGDIALACPPPAAAVWARRRGYLGPGTCRGETRPIGKRVMAVAGDTVRLQDGGVFINGFGVPRSARHEHDSRGRSLSRVSEGAYRLAPGEVWLHGTDHRRSWDSRYFGPVSGELVIGRLVPVWVSGSRDESGWR